MILRFIVPFFSLGLSTKAFSSWQVTERPLEKKPYAREYEHRISISQGFAGIIEGAGLWIEKDQPANFQIGPGRNRPRELEFQVGYLTTEKADPTATCRVTLNLDGESKRTVSIPLRSVDPAHSTVEELGSSFDYLMPAFRFNISPSAVPKSVTIKSDERCKSGRLVLYDPKVWEHINLEPAKRFFLIFSDSIGKAWFEDGRRFMPFVQQYFQGKDKLFSTSVISIATNTNDATLNVMDMRPSLRDPEKLSSAHYNATKSLVPAFLNAGFDVVNYSSNFLLNHEYSHGGFRQYYNIDISSEGASHKRNAEIRVSMYLDWLKRHPEHDAFIFTWFDDTHVWHKPPTYRPEFKPVNLPYNVTPDKQQTLEEQAQALSYIDIQMERLLTSSLAKDATVLLTTDHGLNWNTLNAPTALWPKCSGESRPANHHVRPVEVQTFAALQTPGTDIKAPRHETSLFDWIYTAVKGSFPDVDVSFWSGKLLQDTNPKDYLLSFSHNRRGSFRRDGQHFYFSELSCRSDQLMSILDSNEQDLAEGPRFEFFKALRDQHFTVETYQPVSLRFFQMGSPCKVMVDGLLDDKGAALAVELGSDMRNPWMSSTSAYVPAIVDSVFRVKAWSVPAGCADVQASMIRRSLQRKLDVLHGGLIELSGVPISESYRFKKPTLLIRKNSPSLYTIEQGRLALKDQPLTQKSKISANLKQAMKSWGYIQNEKE